MLKKNTLQLFFALDPLKLILCDNEWQHCQKLDIQSFQKWYQFSSPIPFCYQNLYFFVSYLFPHEITFQKAWLKFEKQTHVDFSSFIRSQTTVHALFWEIFRAKSFGNAAIFITSNQSWRIYCRPRNAVAEPQLNKLRCGCGFCCGLFQNRNVRMFVFVFIQITNFWNSVRIFVHQSTRWQIWSV